MRLVVVHADCRMAAGPSMSEKLPVPSCRSLPWTEQVDSVVLRLTADDVVALAAD